MARKTILLIGATGFVGRHVAVGLLAAGYSVRATSRDPEHARRQLPWLSFTHCDVSSEASVLGAMSDCAAVVYLYHGLGSGPNYPEREAQAALSVRRAAQKSNLERIVYLGGVEPKGSISRHLASRLNTGRLLREGPTPTLELRAAMVIGHQSQSFTLVRDLVVRTPWLALPAWLDHRSCPISICDVAAAIPLALSRDMARSTWLDLRGPECLSHRALLEHLAHAFGTRIVERRLGSLSPSIAALGLSVLTRVPHSVIAELVEGLSSDLLPSGETFFCSQQQTELCTIEEAMADAFADEVAYRQGSVSPSLQTRQRIEAKTRRWLRKAGSASE